MVYNLSEEGAVNIVAAVKSRRESLAKSKQGSTAAIVGPADTLKDCHLGSYIRRNMAKTKYQAFSIHNGPSWCDGINLHINIKEFAQWEDIITQLGFKIVQTIEMHEQQKLYLTTFGKLD